MVDETTTTSKRRRYWPRKRWQQIVLVLAILYAIFALAPLLSSVDSTAGAATNDDALAAQLSSAVVLESTQLDPSILTTQPAQTLAAIPSGCHGRVWRQLTIKVPVTGVTLGWRRTAIDRWCGNTKGVIYDWGAATGDDGKYAFPGYCWSNQTNAKVWNTVSRSEGLVYNQGTMTVCGRISTAKTLKPQVFFHAATSTRPYLYWNYGTGTPILH